MVNKNTRLAVVGILAALGSASAQAADVQQLPSSFQDLANDKCHPSGKYKLGDEESVIPPCVAEQLIFTECEGRAGFINTEGVRQPPEKHNMDIYKQCMLGQKSTLEAERDGCLACKKSNEIFSDDEAGFWRAIYVEAAAKLGESKDAKTLPELYEELRLQRKEFPKPLQENKNVTVPLEEYYPNPPKPQRAGDSEAVEDKDVDEGKGLVRRQVKVQPENAAFASASFDCQRPGDGSFTPAMVPRSPDKASSSSSSVTSGVPTTLVKMVPSAVPGINGTATNGTATNGTRVPIPPGGGNGTKVSNETASSPSPTSPPNKPVDIDVNIDITLIFVMVFTPSQHVMKRQEDGSYVYVLVFGKPAPVADSPETPQKALPSREEGEKRGLPDLSKCGECANKEVALPDVVKADAGKPSTEKADEASKQCLDKVESAVKESGGDTKVNVKVNITIVLVVNIGVTAETTPASPDQPSGKPAVATTEGPAKPSAEPASSGTPRPGVKDNAEGPDKPSAVPDSPAEKPSAEPSSSAPEAESTPEDWCYV